MTNRDNLIDDFVENIDSLPVSERELTAFTV
jgi:hypothetical protein